MWLVLFRILVVATLSWAGWHYSPFPDHLAGLGLGVLFANYLDEVYGWDEASYPSMILIFGGVSLIVFYAIAAKKEKREG